MFHFLPTVAEKELTSISHRWGELLLASKADFIDGIAKWYAEVQDTYGRGRVLSLSALQQWLITPVLAGGGSMPLCQGCTDSGQKVGQLQVQAQPWCASMEE